MSIPYTNRKNTPQPVHSLYSSLSIELKLLANQFESPCTLSNSLDIEITFIYFPTSLIKNTKYNILTHLCRTVIDSSLSDVV